MVARTPTCSQPLAWRKELQQAINTPSELLQALYLPRSLLPGAESGHTLFRLRVPQPFVRRMRHGDIHDPLLRQVLPLTEENLESPGFITDPVGDLNSQRGPGLLHKYQGRVLLITTGACAVNCRYCFRREFPYAEHSAAKGQFAQALDYIAANSDVHEVILSGGDPLLLGTRQLRELSDALATIPHLRRLRIHTRLPIVLPSRVTADLLSWTRQLPWPLAVVMHCNHAREVDDDVREAMAQWRAAGAHLLNQAVLLKGVNDSVNAQAELSETLYQAGVLPYYLHLLDRVQGSAHFEVDETTALSLMENLRQQLSGYLVPRLVREQAGAPYKLPLL